MPRSRSRGGTTKQGDDSNTHPPIAPARRRAARTDGSLDGCGCLSHRRRRQPRPDRSVAGRSRGGRVAGGSTDAAGQPRRRRRATRLEPRAATHSATPAGAGFLRRRRLSARRMAALICAGRAPRVRSIAQAHGERGGGWRASWAPWGARPTMGAATGLYNTARPKGLRLSAKPPLIEIFSIHILYITLYPAKAVLRARPRSPRSIFAPCTLRVSR